MHLQKGLLFSGEPNLMYLTFFFFKFILNVFGCNLFRSNAKNGAGADECEGADDNPCQESSSSKLN